MIECALICHGQERVLVAGVKLLRVSGEGLGAWPKCQVSQAAFFEFGKLAADVVCRASNNAGHAVFTAERDPYLSAGESLLAHERAKSFRQLENALISVKRIGFLAPPNRPRNHAIVGRFVICVASDERKVQHRATDLDNRVPSFGGLTPLADGASLG
jgi:hypothetical protein